MYFVPTDVSELLTAWVCDVSLGQVGLEDLEHAEKLWVKAGFACNDQTGSEQNIGGGRFTIGMWCQKPCGTSTE